MAISGRHPQSVPAAVKTVLAPRLVIARRPEADVAISGRHCRSERAIVKTVRTSDLSLRGGRRPTWQSRSTRSDNRKASANSTPRKAVKA